jgi:hypothetical protein
MKMQIVLASFDAPSFEVFLSKGHASERAVGINCTDSLLQFNARPSRPELKRWTSGFAFLVYPQPPKKKA